MKLPPMWRPPAAVFAGTLASVCVPCRGKSGREVLYSMRSRATVRALFMKPKDVILASLL